MGDPRNVAHAKKVVLVLMMLLLDDFLGVRDVSWVSHQFIDGFQWLAGRISQMRPTRSRLCLAAFRAVEENPDRKIIAEIFKAMFHCGGDKQEIMRGKLPAFARTNEVTCATN